MRAFFYFAMAVIVSQVAAQIAALQLAILFGSREEFILVMVMLGVFGVLAIAVLAVVFVVSQRLRAIHVCAVALAGGAMLLSIGLIAAASLVDKVWPTPYDVQIMIEFLLPALLAVLIQWWIVQRLRRRTV